MTVYIRPSMAERSIGRALWRWREDTGMSLAGACEKAGFSVATLSMMENSLRPFDPLNIMILGRVYDIPNETWKHEVRRAEFATRARAQARTKKSSFELNATRDLDEAYLEATTICTFGADLWPNCHISGMRLKWHAIPRPIPPKIRKISGMGEILRSQAP